MHRRYRRRLSRWIYTLFGVGAGALSAASIDAAGPLSWQAFATYALIAALSVFARRADAYIAAMAREVAGVSHRVARAKFDTVPTVGPVPGRMDY